MRLPFAASGAVAEAAAAAYLICMGCSEATQRAFEMGSRRKADEAGPPRKTREEEKQARLADELRANLLKRKAQVRARAKGPSAADTTGEDDGNNH